MNYITTTPVETLLQKIGVLIPYDTWFQVSPWGHTYKNPNHGMLSCYGLGIGNDDMGFHLDFWAHGDGFWAAFESTEGERVSEECDFTGVSIADLLRLIESAKTQWSEDKVSGVDCPPEAFAALAEFEAAVRSAM